ncbi:MAG: orotidine 5'-phosphate decarboxylase [Devosia sp.]|nr:orotidine 5'-phosphate decarboxylase [Devosia sp.]
MTSLAASVPTASMRVLDLLRRRFSFQISVDTDNVPQGLVVAEAALAAGVTLIELGTPLLKTEGVRNVVPIFRQRFPQALLLADMKTMDGGAYEAAGVYQGGGNIIDFLALAGVASARGICAVRDQYRERTPDVPRLAFADILVPHQGPAALAVAVARQMVDAGVDGVGLHLQLDARRADPALMQSGHLADIAAAVFDAVGAEVSVQVVGGLSIDQARLLAARGLRAFVISGNMGLPDAVGRYALPPVEMTGLMATFIREVSGV